MSRAILCDRCGKAVQKAGQMFEINVAPYVSMRAVSASNVETADLCEDCTKTLKQYINNEVQMIVFKDKEAANDPVNNNPGI